MWFKDRTPGARGALLLAGALAAATGFTFWLGLRATREWRQTSSVPLPGRAI